MDKALKLMIWVIILSVSFSTKPVCYFPDKAPQLREANLKDIELRLNELTTSPLWLYHTGASMYPTIKDGQTCLCEEQEEYIEGDIISFYQLNNGNEINFITHRIKEITPKGYITKGDNNERIDYTTVPEKNVFCKIREEPNILSLLREDDENGN